MKLNKAKAQRIRQLLKEKNMTVYALSLASGVLQSTLSNIINCKAESTSDTVIYNICRGFGIPIKDFYDVSLFDFENITDDD